MQKFEVWRVLGSGCLTFPIEHHIGYGVAVYAQTVQVWRWVAMVGLVLIYGGDAEHYSFVILT